MYFEKCAWQFEAGLSSWQIKWRFPSWKGKHVEHTGDQRHTTAEEIHASHYPDSPLFMLTRNTCTYLLAELESGFQDISWRGTTCTPWNLNSSTNERPVREGFYKRWLMKQTNTLAKMDSNVLCIPAHKSARCTCVEQASTRHRLKIQKCDGWSFGPDMFTSKKAHAPSEHRNLPRFFYR